MNMKALACLVTAQHFFYHNLSDQLIKNVYLTTVNTAYFLLFNDHYSDKNPPLLAISAEQASKPHHKEFSFINSDLPLKESIAIQANNLKQALENNAASFGFNCHDVPRDGLCFFSAVEHQLSQLTANFVVIKYSAKNLLWLFKKHILSNKQYYEEKITEPEQFEYRVSSYQENWNTEVGDFAIPAMSRVLNINIVIISSDVVNDEIKFTVYKLNQPLATIFLGYEAGIHYQSLIKNNAFSINKIQELIDAADIDDWTPSQSEVGRRESHYTLYYNSQLPAQQLKNSQTNLNNREFKGDGEDKDKSDDSYKLNAPALLQLIPVIITIITGIGETANTTLKVFILMKGIIDDNCAETISQAHDLEISVMISTLHNINNIICHFIN